MKYFILDGMKGSVDQFNFVRWLTIGCHLDSMQDDCALKVAALKAK